MTLYMLLFSVKEFRTRHVHLCCCL